MVHLVWLHPAPVGIRRHLVSINFVSLIGRKWPDAGVKLPALLQCVAACVKMLLEGGKSRVLDEDNDSLEMQVNTAGKP